VVLSVWRDDRVHPQVLDYLAIVVGNVPHSHDRNSKPCIGAAIGTVHPGQSVLGVDGRQNLVAISEGIAQILEQLGLRLGGRRSTLLAVLRRRLALNLVEEGEIGTGYMLKLLRERTRSFELAGIGNEGIFGVRHCLGHREELSLGPTERSAHTVGDVFGDFVLCVDSWNGRDDQEEDGDEGGKFQRVILEKGREQKSWQSLPLGSQVVTNYGSTRVQKCRMGMLASS